MGHEDLPPPYCALDTLRRFWPRPETPDTRPLVYGYLRSRIARPSYIAGCVDTLERWCAHESWRLGGIFRDVGVPGGALVRPGFTAALDALGVGGSGGLALVNAGHLSHRPEIALYLADQVEHAGVQVLLFEGSLPTPGLPEWTA
jgi:hypothetical protein